MRDRDDYNRAAGCDHHDTMKNVREEYRTPTHVKLIYVAMGFILIVTALIPILLHGGLR